MKKKLFIAVCKRNGWEVTKEHNELLIRQETPAGEDFSFCVSDAYDPMEVFRYAEDFDAEEHCIMWLNAKWNGVSGVPDLFDLVDDARELQMMLDTLANDLIITERDEYRRRQMRRTAYA